MTLTEFLLARIAEDERAARQGRALDDPVADTYGTWDHARVLAECEAKRRIVERAVAATSAADAWTHERLKTDTRDPLPEWARRDAYCEVLRDMAAVYADHPDYAKRWSPGVRDAIGEFTDPERGLLDDATWNVTPINPECHDG